jgi:hypothetical protein
VVLHRTDHQHDHAGGRQVHQRREPVRGGDYSRTPSITRNTWIQWTFPGDYFLPKAPSRFVKITCIPIVKVSLVRNSNGTTTVSGSATRRGGYAILWRLVSGSWTKLQQVNVSSTGTYTFGTKTRAKGSYRVTTVADASWGAGVKAFSI